MLRFAVVTFALAFSAGLLPAFATAPPHQVATVVVHGFNPGGASSTGVFGEDSSVAYLEEIATTLGLPTSLVAPSAPNQVAYTTYYGDQYPYYYTAQDIRDMESLAVTDGPGVPMYAAIMGKYAREVMRRSGATQINLMGLSFGGLISRYMIEKDVEALASSGSIARWICIDGVVAGNYAATHGGPIAQNFFETNYGGNSIDFQQMNYEWVRTHLNDPRDSSISRFFGTFPTHFYLAADDNAYGRVITNLSGKANDGVVLLEDGELRNLPPSASYLGLPPTKSIIHATHEGTKTYTGIRAGLGAQVYGRRRVRVTLESVRILNEFDGGARGNGEYVFGLKVFSPIAQALAGIAQPIHELRADDNSFPFFTLAVNALVTVNQVWFDDMILPGETQLRLETNVDEVDGDAFIYNITEESGEVIQQLADTSINISTETPGRYTLQTADWEASIKVEMGDYPAFQEINRQNAAQNWSLYQ